METTQPGRRIVKPSFRREEQRGLFVEILNEGPWETVIHGTMRPGGVMGNHYHKRTTAFFYLVRGKAQIVIRHMVDQNEERLELNPGEGVYFYPYETHAIRYLEPSDFIFLKSTRFREDNPDLFPAPVMAP
jgi:mannose-6-phosphate isomerase-like protein (cupin superfamily)